MFAYSLSAYALFALVVWSGVPVWVFVPLGIPLFIRSFHWMHESYHADRKRPGSPWFRQLPLVVSVLQLDHDSLRKDHLFHHAHLGTTADPDRWLTSRRSAWGAFLLSLVHAEVSWVNHVLKHGFTRHLQLGLLRHTVIATSLVALAGPSALAWFAMTRLANSLAWFVFDYLLHHPRFYGEGRGFPMPPMLQLVWTGLFGADNADAVAFHRLHHARANIPGHRLRAVATLERVPAGSQAPQLAS